MIDCLSCYCSSCFLFSLLLDLLGADVLPVHAVIIVALDARIGHQDEEDATKEQSTAHEIAPKAPIADQKHGGDENIEEAFARHRLEELKVLRNELNLAERHDQHKAKNPATSTQQQQSEHDQG